MDFFADLLIAAGALGVAAFCFVLSRRLKALGRLDSGIGGAIAVLTAQVDDLTRALKTAQATARDSASKLENQTRRADAACRQLELLMASLHDLPPADATRPARRRRHEPAAEADASGRPLARWNTNRLHAEAGADPLPAEAGAAAEPALATLPRALDPVEIPAEPPVKRARSRVVRRRQRAGARA